MARRYLPDNSDIFPFSDPISSGAASRVGRAAALIDATDEGVGVNASASETYLGVSVDLRAIRTVFAVASLLAAIVVLRAFDIQVVRGGQYLALSEGNRSRVVRVSPERGIIYDRRGAPLVRNVPDFNAAVTPADLPKDPQARLETLDRLSETIGVARAEIERQILTFSRYPTLAVAVGNDLTHEQAVRIRLGAPNLPGVSLHIGSRREYLNQSSRSMSHVLGYEGRLTDKDLAAVGSEYLPTDTIGRTGLERVFETVLRGRSGTRRIEVDAIGREKKLLAEEAAEPGKSLVLTVDLDLQAEAERALKAALKKFGKSRGSVIVMRPNGEVLAMVSEPDFDANQFAKGISSEDYERLIEDKDDPLFSRAIGASLPSGSTFKPVIAGASLQEKLITPATTVLSTGGIYYGKWFFPDWKAGGHGATNVTKALAESVNTFFYAIGGGYQNIEGLGPERIASYARRFGFGSALGIDLPGEGDGFLPSEEWKERTKNEAWYIGDTYHIAIGQGDILVTPLQIAAMTSVFANGGTLYRPHVAAAVTSNTGSREDVKPEIIRSQVLEPAVIETVRKGMRQTVTAGSGRGLLDLPVAVAAKTGTAQWSSDKPPHAWFTSFAPFDEPEIVVTAMIEEGEEGSRTTAQVAKEIYAWYFRDRRK